ncbi:cytochrome ubiquinol oxidase subunit I [Desulfotomaculum sp. 1211_IL3151]|uniref:cytochrome ubiquinol oxidase subunit I n=1 Tax=Desulfotomaculum sp. 1211_IL3151 TaxID=3084055 RepID=UPI002FDA1F93
MNELLLARWQFGITTIYHFLFVPLTLGLSVLVAIMQTMYVRTGDETYKKMTKFWGKLFLINFAMGVVTGIVQEFHFGMNWSEYSRFVGDIFGAPLAIEALLAFFLESTFIGIWIFGWDKLPKKLHALSIWVVAIGSSISALWILIANSFMQAPVGYALRNGRAEMTDFLALITNPHIFYQYPHTVLGGYVTGAFFVMGISAYYLLKKRDLEIFRRSFKIGLIFGLISVFLVTTVGHMQGQYLVKTQPMKMAAAEAHWETADPAPFVAVAVVDEKNQTNSFEIAIPKMLSFMSYNTFSGEVKGLKELQAEAEVQYGPGNYIPPVTPIFWSFRIMVGAGTLMVFVALVSLYFWRRGTLESKPMVLKALLWSIPLPYLANSTGWYMTEAGRQPWVVYGLQKVENGVSSSVSAGEILITLIGFTLIYGVLALAALYLILKFIKQGPEQPVQTKLDITDKGVSLWT